MATLILNLAKEVKVRAEAQALEAGFASVDDYIADLIKGDDATAVDAKLESELLRGVDSGPSIPLTPEFLNDIKRRARQV